MSLSVGAPSRSIDGRPGGSLSHGFRLRLPSHPARSFHPVQSETGRDVVVVLQQGQVFKLMSSGADGTPRWAYRYRIGGRDGKRVQRGGFASEEDARAALERALEKLRRENGIARTLTLAEFVGQYLEQHEASPVTLKKLRFLLARAVAAFGDYRLDELNPFEIAAWRMTVPRGYRFEATQALRQVLARAVLWQMLDVNPAKQGVENPQRRRTEKRPFESWDEIEAVAERLQLRLAAMVLFAAATGMRPGEWVALEHRDIDRDARVAYVHRSFSKGRLTSPKTEASKRAVPLQARALAALDPYRPVVPATCSSPPRVAATSTCTTSATATGSPPSSRPGSSRSGASTISGTRSRPSHSVPVSPPSSSRVTWAPA
jgi:integrase